MKLLIISGPSGSGKSTLSKKITKKLKNGIILNTDNYYKTGILSKILSKIIPFYFDKKISFNANLFNKDLDFILENNYSNYTYKYDYQKKSSKKIYSPTHKIRFVIIEGIFASFVLKRSFKDKYFLIKLKTSKNTCLKRVIKRDCIERGKNKNVAKRDFFVAWKLFHKYENPNEYTNYFKKIEIGNKVNVNKLINRIF